MLEVPSLLFQIDEICRAADFVSVGSNDLMQFLFAVDRENRMVADRFDPLSAPSLRALKLVAESAARLKCPATVCGEIGGRPLEAMALIGLGYRSLSMSPTSIGPVKAMLLTLDAAKVGALIERGTCALGRRHVLEAGARRLRRDPRGSDLTMSIAPPSERLDAILARHDIVMATLNAGARRRRPSSRSRASFPNSTRSSARSAPTGPPKRT